MNVNSGGPHILLFERDQQLTTLLSSELARAGYEVHTARTAVEVFDAIARFPVRLVMVDLAQAQASRREFWVALDAQRRGRGVQVFTFRCTNLGGYGPDDPDERVETVLTDLEVDGPGGAPLLVAAVRERVPGSTVTTTAQVRQALGIPEAPYQSTHSNEVPVPPPFRQASPIYQPLQQASPMYQSAHMPQVAPVQQQAAPMYQSAHMPQVVPAQPASPMYQSAHMPQVVPAQQQAAPTYQFAPVQQPAAPMYQSVPMPQVAPAQPASPIYPPAPTYQQMPIPQGQSLHGTLRPQPPEVQVPPLPAHPTENPRPHSTFTDKIRAVFYPSSHSFSSVPETNGSVHPANGQAQQAAQYQNPDVQPRPHASQRFEEADYQTIQSGREESIYPVPSQGSAAPGQSYTNYGASSTDTNTLASPGESGLDQLSRMLRESQPTPQNTVINGHIQNSAARPGLIIDPQEIQDFRAQILQAARQDEALGRSNMPQPLSADTPGVSTQLRASPIQDLPFEQEVAQRRGLVSNAFPPANDIPSRSTMTAMQPTQAIPQQSQSVYANAQAYAGSGSQLRPVAPPETPLAPASASEANSLSPVYEASPRTTQVNRQASSPLSLDGESALPEQVRVSLQQTASRRPEIKTTDDTLLDIVKSLPPMSPAPQPPAPEPQILNGRATRSLGSVLLEGHLVPQERLQVAQHVQRMMRGVDLNYQLGEILLMFKLLTPDQLLAASLVSYGMISTVQISSLGRIRQELHAMGLEYDLESLLVLFRILSPEQLREVRASWTS